MSIPNYRTILSFDAEQNLFRARSPELEHCFGEGKTRSEAIAHLEQEIEAQLRHLKDQGQTVPKSLDEQVYTGEISTHVSQHLHKELVWQARLEGVELQQLLSEILASGLELRRQLGRSSKPQNRNDGNRAPNANREHQGNRNYGSNYRPELFDDRANFIQYVRGMEQGTSRGPSSHKEKTQRHQPNRKNHRNHNRNRQNPGTTQPENKQTGSPVDGAHVQDVAPVAPVQSAPEVNSSEKSTS